MMLISRLPQSYPAKVLAMDNAPRNIKQSVCQCPERIAYSLDKPHIPAHAIGSSNKYDDFSDLLCDSPTD